MSVRVLLADDHGAVRAGLRALLERAEDIEVVGEAADGQAAVLNARALRPDVVLMDVRMPVVDGVAATGRIVAEGSAAVLVLTTFDEDEVVLSAIRAGAAGFLLKTAEAPELVSAVRRVAAGEGVVAPEVTRRVFRELAAGASPAAPDVPADSRLARLTERERKVPPSWPGTPDWPETKPLRPSETLRSPSGRSPRSWRRRAGRRPGRP